MFRPNAIHRRNAIALCTALLVFQSLGWLTGWYVVRQELRWTMRRAMQDGRVLVRTLTLLAADLAAIRVEAREIQLDGERYDIYAQEIFGDSIRLGVCRDAAEERWYEVLDSLFGLSDRPAHGPVSPLSAWWINWLKAAFLPAALADPPAPSLPGPERTRRFFSCLLPVAQASPARFSPPPEAGPHSAPRAPITVFR